MLVLVLAACTNGITTVAAPPASSATPLPLATFTAAPTATRPAIAEVDRYAFEQNERLGRGVNFGNALEAPVEGEWGMVIEERFFDLVKEAGFSSLRIPTRWTSHAGLEAPYTIDPAFFERVDWVVAQGLKRELAVVLNLHHFDGDIYESPSDHKARFLAIWKQISEHYADQPDGLFFELFNEPYGTLSTTSAWNQMAAEAIAIIRNTNPQRIIVVGPGQWNSYRELYGLQLPEADRRLIVTFHYYEPFEFTHQGAEWVENSDPWLGRTWGTEQDQRAVQDAFAQVRKWADFTRRPIYLGEFGAYSKADLESRVKWTAFVAREAEKQGFSWAYWEFGAGFGVYDREKQAWNEGIFGALVQKP
jgi:endoglucanase